MYVSFKWYFWQKWKISILRLGLQSKDRKSTRDKANINNPKVNSANCTSHIGRLSADFNWTLNTIYSTKGLSHWGLQRYVSRGYLKPKPQILSQYFTRACFDHIFNVLKHVFMLETFAILSKYILCPNVLRIIHKNDFPNHFVKLFEVMEIICQYHGPLVNVVVHKQLFHDGWF